MSTSRKPLPHLALLRGINVGGKNKVEMSRLRGVFESLGFGDVRTYINSGNVIFDAVPSEVDPADLEAGIIDEFGLAIPVLLRDGHSIERVRQALPEHWVNDSTMKCDVMFLWDDVDDPAVLDRLAIKDGIDDVVYVPGALLWRVDRDHVTRSGMMKLAGTKLYSAMTIRNCNTVRKLAALMSTPT